MKRFFLLVISVGLLSWAVFAAKDSEHPAPVEIKSTWAPGGIQPRISADGERIAFSYQGAIWTCPRAGGVMTRLSDGEGFDWEPCWSPDGKRIALVRSPYELGGDLQLIDAVDGKEVVLPRRVQVRGTFAYYKLEFHPDGKRVLGVFRVEGKDYGFAWYDVSQGTVQSLATLPSWSRYALSPDGKWIVYTGTLDVTGQQTGNDGVAADIWKMPSEGGEPEKIVRFPSRIHDLCWNAADGSLIVVSELGGAHYDLWRVPFKDSLRGMSKLTFGQADEDRPSVSHDGRWLVYTDNRRGPTALMWRDLVTGDERPLPFDHMQFRFPTGKLRLSTLDRDGKKPVTARIALKQEAGKHHAPVGALYRSLRGYGHFYCDQTAELVLPAGKYQLRAFRGPEYRATYHEFAIQVGKTHELPVELERWTHAAKNGWYSGENHIHANYGYGQWYNTPRTMLQQCGGEDLNVCNFMVANSDTDGVFDRAFFRGGADPLSTSENILYWNQEFRSTGWGHMTLLNLRQVVEPVFTGFKDTTNPWDVPTNADIAERTHWQKGVVNYTHVAQNPDDPFVNPYAAKGMPIDVALGKTDTLDINNSYAGSVPIWHRLLNCGFRLPATAGTDCFLNRIYSRLPGGDRVYVKTSGPLDYAEWIAGLKAGRSFVTNGPMLEFSVGESNLGDTIKIKQPETVTVKAKVDSHLPLAKFEIFYNGVVVAAADLTTTKDGLTHDRKIFASARFDGNEKKATFTGEVRLAKSGWLAVRASGPGHADSATPILYAHTNPIYVELAEAPLRSRQDALFFLNWIEKVAVEMRGRERTPNEEMRQHVLNQIEAARMVYAKIAREAGDVAPGR